MTLDFKLFNYKIVGIYENSQSQHGYGFGFGIKKEEGREPLLGMALDFRLLIKKLLKSITIHN